jgi:hypothetical protein
MAIKLARQAARKRPSVSPPTPAQLGSAPLLECLAPIDLFRQGMGHVVIARRLPQSHVAVGCFLVDVCCLGVKDAFLANLSAEQYAHRFGELQRTCGLRTVEPSYARSLIEQAVEYAASLGLKPHADYAEAAAIMGDIDASLCTQHFEFGREGKPAYYMSVHDDNQTANAIVETLQRTCGPDGFHFVMPFDELESIDSDEESVYVTNLF